MVGGWVSGRWVEETNIKYQLSEAEIETKTGFGKMRIQMTIFCGLMLSIEITNNVFHLYHGI